MSKIISVILVLVLFFGTTINCFADNKKLDNNELGLIFVGVYVLGGLFVFWIGTTFAEYAEVEPPDDGIGLVSAEEKTSILTTDGKNVLNILKHFETGVTPNKDIYIGLCFRY